MRDGRHSWGPLRQRPHVLHIDEGYLEPLTQTLRGLCRLPALPEVDVGWRGRRFDGRGDLLSLAFHGDGKRAEQASVARMRVCGPDGLDAQYYAV